MSRKHKSWLLRFAVEQDGPSAGRVGNAGQETCWNALCHRDGLKGPTEGCQLGSWHDLSEGRRRGRELRTC